MNQKGQLCLLISILLIFTQGVLSVHLSQISAIHYNATTQLQTLLNQQSSFQSTVNLLVSNLKGIDAQINATSNASLKVVILQKAITSQRQKIFQLQQAIIPPFNLSRSSCQQLTNSQKTALLKQIVAARTQLTKLHAMANGMASNPVVTQIQADISNQQTVIIGIEKVINSKCANSTVFSPAIFQSNLYATNWVLGKQSITNLVDQYYQRGLMYSSVSNCPLATPYFDGVSCIQCNGTSGVFNMQTGLCEKCPFGSILHTAKHLCIVVPHFTNYANLNNYVLGGSKALPVPPNNVSSCPSTMPYFNGTSCMQCSLPEYWDVNKTQCLPCATGLVFDPNTKNCTHPHNNTMSFLFGNSSWVTAPGNFTKVLAARANLTALNKNYTVCGRLTPYFDGIRCINCPQQFNLTSKTCVNASKGFAYDPNLHTYVKVQANMATSPFAKNLITPGPLPFAPAYCNSSVPFYDGIACIKCPSPFPYFNVTSNTCVQCSATKYYDNITQQCIPRPVVFISANFTNIIATKGITLAQYKAQLYNMVKNNSHYIIKQCPPGEYSNLTHCFPCSKGLFFNIQSLTCVPCNGTINSTTYICHHFKTMLTNLNASGLIFGVNKTKAYYLGLQKQVVGPVAGCPSSTPYSVNGTHCIACNSTSTPYFDVQNQSCVGCGPSLYFDIVAHSCKPGINITNTSALISYYGNGNFSIANVTKNLTAISKIRKTFMCPGSKPLALKNGSCVNCSGNYYVDLKTMSCQHSVIISNFPILRASRVIQLGKNNLTTLEVQQRAVANGTPVVYCPAAKPLYNGRICLGCNSSQYYNLQGLSCYTPLMVSNISAIAATHHYIQSSNNTLNILQAAISASVLPVLECPSGQPLFNGSSCLGCSSGQYYNLGNLTCYTASLSSNVKALNASHKFVNIGSHTLANLANNISTSLMPLKPCPSYAPLFNGSFCIGCPPGDYYDLRNLQCIKARFVSNVAALTATGKVVQTGQYTIPFLQAQIAAQVLPVKLCPVTAPFFNGLICVACPAGQYYLIETLSCYSPVYSSNVGALSAAGNVVQVGGHTLTALNNSIAAQPFPTKPCPSATPFLSQGKCVGCPVGQYYNLQTRRCYKPQPSTNIALLNSTGRFVNVGNATLTALMANASKNPYPTVSCPNAAPVWNGTHCVYCAPGTYYLLNNFTCYSPKFVSSVAHLNKTKNYINVGNSTLASLMANISASKFPVKGCPPSTPVFNGTHCFACPNGTYYLLNNLTCYTPKLVTNVTLLNKTKNFINVGNATLASIMANVSASKYPVKSCNSSAPLFNGTHCVGCPNGTYYLLNNFTCYVPKNVSNVAFLNKTKNFISVGNFTLTSIMANITSSKFPVTVCNSSVPLFNGTHCFACPNGTYYLLNNFTCYIPKNVSNVSAIAASHRYIQIGNHTLNNLTASINASAYPVLTCPSSLPFFNGSACFGCPSGQFYNLQNLSCYSAQLASNVSALGATHRYVNLGSYTLINLSHNISSSILPVKLCPSSTPLFNGTACFGCPIGLYYDLKNLKCISARYVSNVTALNATGKVVQIGQYTLAFLKAQIAAQVVPTKYCPGSTPLYNGTSCEACPIGQYYLIETLSCYKPVFSSNVSALNASGKALQIGNFTLANLNKTIAAQPFPTKPCPSATPFLSQGKCVGCPVGQYYNLQTRRCYKPQPSTNIALLNSTGRFVNVGNATLTALMANASKNPYPTVSCPNAAPVWNGTHCVYCAPGTYYLLNNFTCYSPKFVSSVAHLNKTKNYINVGNSTLASLMANISASKFPVKGCPPSTPVFNGTHCFACPNGTYYLLNNLTCYVPKNATNVAYLNKTNTYYNLGNATLSAVFAAIKASTYPVKACPNSTPYFNGSKCIACPNGTYYYLGPNNLTSHTQVCNKPVFVTNTGALVNYFGNGGFSLGNTTKKLKKLALTMKTLSCPSSKPLALKNGTCVGCSGSHYVDLKTMSCQPSVIISNFPLLRVSRVIQLGSANLTTLEAQQRASAHGAPVVYCPINKPLYNGRSCMGCSFTQYYNLQGLSCYSPQLTSNVSAIAATHHYIQSNNNTLNILQAAISASVLPVLECPSGQPLFNGSSCLGCSSGQYYNLGNLTCYTASLSSNVKALNASHKFVNIGSHTLANLANNISTSLMPLKPCPSYAPLFNGSFCIGCPPGDYYDLRNLQCIKARFVSNVAALTATGKVVQTGQYTIPFLQAQIAAQVLPVKLCPVTAPFFNGLICVACPAGQYYLIETLSCYSPVYSSNVGALSAAGNVVQVGGHTLTALNNSIAAQPFPTKPCPSATPFLSQGKCVGCPVGQYYNLQTRRCYKPQPSTNIALLNSTGRFVNVGNATLTALMANASKNPYPTVSCPNAAPVWNGTHCVYCAPGTYYLLNNFTCYSPKFVSSVAHLNKTKNYINVGNSTLASLMANISASKFPVKGCPPSTPVFNGTHCFACPNGTYYLLNNLTCYTPKLVTNVTLLNKTKNFINVGNATLASIMANVSASKYPVKSCNSSAPLFNGTHCVGCPNGTYYLLNNFTCYVPKNVSNVAFLNKTKNFISVGNFTLTSIMANITSSKFPVTVCNSSVPLFNGTHCFACPNGTYYLLNNFTCYVTQNVSNVSAIAASHRYIQVGNHTLNNLTASIKASIFPVNICPQATPISNGSACLFCPSGQFYNIQNLQCYSTKLASNISALNATHRYVNIGSSTLVNLANSIKSSVFPHGICPSTKPLFNGSVCIVCPVGQYYDLKNLKCISARLVSNVVALNATGKVVQIGHYTLGFLKAQIAAQVLPIQLCPTATPFYNGSSCIICPPSQYYLIETLSCYKPVFSSNVSALNASGKALQIGNFTLANLNKTIAAQPFPTKPCPSATPFLSQGKCVGCPVGQYYNLQTRRCYKPQPSTNIALLNSTGRFVNVGNATLTALMANASKNPYPTVSCPNAAPVWNGTHCVYCAPGTYYLLNNFTCYSPKFVSSVAHLNKTKNYINVGNSTLASLMANISASKFPVKGCPPSTPVFNGTHCFACPNGTYYLLNNLTCYVPKNVSNIYILNKTKNFINVGPHTLSSINATISASKYPVKACNASTPIFDGTKCIGCPNGTYYLLNNFTCYTAIKVSNVAYLNKTNNFVNIGSSTLTAINATISASKYPVNVCPSSTPLFNGVKCMACPNGTYYLLSNLTCYTPKNVSNVSYLNKTKNYVNMGKATLSALNSSISASLYPVKICPSSTPLFNGVKCMGCANGSYYLLSNLTCYTLKNVTNITELNMLKNYVNVGVHTLTSINATISASVYPVRVCPASLPLFNGTQCLGCNANQYYNFGNLSCQNPNYISNIVALTLSNNYIVTSAYNMTTLTVASQAVLAPVLSCPSSKPLYNGSACIACPAALYDITNKKCASCASGYYYNQTQHLCLPTPKYYPNLNNTLWIVNNATGMQQLINMTNQRKLLKGAQICPNNKPNYNHVTNTCLACPTGQLWNYNNVTCQVCPAGLIVDPMNRVCSKKLIGVYQTNLNSANLLFNGISKAQYQANQNNNLASYPNLKDCPLATPYFDGFGCIACKTAPYTLFSMLHKVCTACPPNSTFHPSSNTCITSGGALASSPPNVAKMYSSIF